MTIDGVLDDRELDPDIEAVMDHPDPGEVREEAVDRQGDKRAVERGKAIRGPCDRYEFARADWREVRRMREEHYPAAAQIGERELPLCAPRGKAGNRLAKPKRRRNAREGWQLSLVGHGSGSHAAAIDARRLHTYMISVSE
ncbi:hypothetical protein GCM10009087_26930 [Sphingomonas oligophenolica]